MSEMERRLRGIPLNLTPGVMFVHCCSFCIERVERLCFCYTVIQFFWLLISIPIQSNISADLPSSSIQTLPRQHLQFILFRRVVSGCLYGAGNQLTEIYLSQQCPSFLSRAIFVIRCKAFACSCAYVEWHRIEQHSEQDSIVAMALAVCEWAKYIVDGVEQRWPTRTELHALLKIEPIEAADFNYGDQLQSRQLVNSSWVNRSNGSQWPVSES